MTIICYRDGIMAADTALSCQDGYDIGHANKIVRGPSGIAAACGHCAAAEAFASWFRAGENGKPPLDEEAGNFGAIIVYNDFNVQRMDGKGRRWRVQNAYYADGAAREMATGAMAAGATAEQAVRICIALHHHCGGEAQVEHLAA